MHHKKNAKNAFSKYTTYQRFCSPGASSTDEDDKSSSNSSITNPEFRDNGNSADDSGDTLQKEVEEQVIVKTEILGSDAELVNESDDALALQKEVEEQVIVKTEILGSDAELVDPNYEDDSGDALQKEVEEQVIVKTEILGSDAELVDPNYEDDSGNALQKEVEEQVIVKTEILGSDAELVDESDDALALQKEVEEQVIVKIDNISNNNFFFNADISEDIQVDEQILISDMIFNLVECKSIVNSKKRLKLFSVKSEDIPLYTTPPKLTDITPFFAIQDKISDRKDVCLSVFAPNTFKELESMDEVVAFAKQHSFKVILFFDVYCV
jgi:uncharacterized protein